MADVVSTKVLHDGPRNVTVKLTGISDGTGETLVNKVDVLSLFPKPSRLTVQKIEYDLSGMQALLYWGGTPNVLIATLSSGQATLDFTSIGGLTMQGVGADGSILLSSLSAGNNDTYSIILHLKKKY